VQYDIRLLNLAVILFGIGLDVGYAIMQDVQHEMNGCVYVHGKVLSIISIAIVCASDLILSGYFGLILLRPTFFGFKLKKEVKRIAKWNFCFSIFYVIVSVIFYYTNSYNIDSMKVDSAIIYYAIVPLFAHGHRVVSTFVSRFELNLEGDEPALLEKNCGQGVEAAITFQKPSTIDHSVPETIV